MERKKGKEEEEKEKNPTGSFKMFGPPVQEIGAFYVVHQCHATDFKAKKLRNGWSGRRRRKRGNISVLVKNVG